MITRSIAFELRRSFNSAGVRISLIIGCIISLADLYTFYWQYGAPGERILIQAWIGTDFQFAYNSLFYVLFPIIACLPYAGSYYRDIHSGYDKNICTRISRKHYLVAKCIAVYISAFICTVAPLLGNLFLSAGLYPNKVPEKLNFLSAGIIDCHRFPVLFSEKPAAYCLLFILIDGLFAGAMAMISIAAAKFCKSQFSAIVVPFVVYILTGVLMVSESGHSIAVMEMINPIQRYISSIGQMCGIYFAIMIVSISIIWRLGRKRDIL